MSRIDTSRRVVRLVLYLMLLGSAGTTLFVGPRLWTAVSVGKLPVWMALMPMLSFTAFVLVYAVDRWLLVRRRRYPSARALLQVALTLVFLTFLWPSQAGQWRSARAQLRQSDPVEVLLQHRDARVRAAACELLGYRDQQHALELITNLAEADPRAEVRDACRRALENLQH